MSVFFQWKDDSTCSTERMAKLLSVGKVTLEIKSNLNKVRSMSSNNQRSS